MPMDMKIEISLIGLFFGSKSMSKKDIDKRITEYIAGQLDEGFPDLLHQYFQKSI